MEKEISRMLDWLADEFTIRVNEKLRPVISQEMEKQERSEKFMTTNQVCSLLCISKSTLYRHRNEGYITPAKYVGRKPLYDQSSIDNYLDAFSLS